MHNSILLAIFSRPATYLDPGSGSMLIQLIIGAVLGVGVFLRVFWKNIKNLFTGKKATAEDKVDPTAIVDDPTAVTDKDPSDKPTELNI